MAHNFEDCTIGNGCADCYDGPPDYAASIRDTMSRATIYNWNDGLDWYRSALDTCSSLAGEFASDTDTVARIIAVLSPRKRWAQNVEAAGIILREWASGATEAPYIAGTLGMNVRKAWAIANGDPSQLRGQKVTRFYMNILGIDTEVTVDVWAMRAAGIFDHDAPTVTEYADIAEAYVTVAKEYNVSPSALQAVAWTVIRGKAA